MSFLDKFKARLQEVADATSEKMSEFITEPEVVVKRIDICKACPELIHVTMNCKKCGCFVHAKTKIKSAECPLKKW